MPKGHYNRKNRRSSPQPSLQPTTGETQTVTQERPAHIDSGEEARGAVNARENQTRTQPEPEPTIRALGDTVIAMRPPKSVRGSIMETRRENLSTQGQEKHQLLTTVGQRLAEAADLLREGGEKAKEGKALCAAIGVELFKARADGLLSAEQLSSMLGDKFGWKKKGGGDEPVKGGDPEAGKTPFGEGEAIRKRVVRAVQAHEFVEGDEPSKFFDGLPKAKVSDVLTRVRNDNLSIYSAYDMLGTIKRDAVTKITPAYDPKAVAKFVEALQDPKMAQAWVDSPALVDSYLALHDMIVEVDREATALAKQAA